MAAIAGIINTDAEAGEERTDQVEMMLQLMRHRGPDNMIVRTLPEGNGAIGSIEINLTPEKTNSAAVARSPYIVFDGELFNGRAEGMTDVELFKEYYLKHGKECFTYLDGSYCCAIIEPDEVILARDQVGPRPLFYGSQNGTLFFSTEMKGLGSHLRTDIHELPPQYFYSTRDGLVLFKPYSPDVPDPGDDLKTAAGILRELMIEATKKRMPGIKASALSGGLDSSIVAAIAKGFNPDIHLITATIDSKPGPDLENAKVMAEFLGSEHHIYRITDDEVFDCIPEMIWYLESFDEDCIVGQVSNYYASMMAKDYTDLVFVGEGADELFGGYRMVLKHPSVTTPERREELAQKLLDIAYNTALRRLDRGWMANAVAYETPFLDAKVIAFSQKVPMDWKIYGDRQVEKYILREAFRDMLPEQIANREKLRFSMGVGTEDVMERMVAKVANPEELKERPKTPYGMSYASFKEIYYYDEFIQMFPPSYEKQTIRWDPFK
ncbi:MAG: asparagine synthase-related protein [Dehalococcoidia bacterium]